VAIMALREFRDETGRSWRVWETVPATATGLTTDLREGWLTFDDGEHRRRLWPVPPNWSILPSDRLTLLLRLARGAEEPAAVVRKLEDERRVAERRVSERRQEERRKPGRRSQA
jgi:hypothetical protein